MTKRQKDCIICGGKTGTGEHVFPSALGGRRENKGIYCPNHNHWMGSHVGVLQQQLGLINAMLEVEPDRGSAKPFLVEAHDGQRFAIAGAEIRLAPDLDQILDSYQVGQSQQLKLDPALLPKLKARAGQRGLKLEIIERTPPSTEYRLEPHLIRLSQGGDDAMRAVAYLTLTFVAHNWADVARSPGLISIKDMLRSGSIYAGVDRIGSPLAASKFVSWTPAIYAPAELVHPTGLGHTIITCISAGQVLAYVSLLDLQCFMVRLGEAGADYTDRTVVIHVDPLETHFGKDWTTHVFDSALIDDTVNPAYLGQAVLESDQMQQQVSGLMQRVIARRDRLEAQQAAKEFDAANDLPAPDRRVAIRSFVERRSQRLVNLMVMFSQHGDDATPLGALVRGAANRATQRDPSSSDGLNESGRRVLNDVVTKIAEALADAASGYVLDEERYLGLFSGDLGNLLMVAALAEESSSG